MGAVDEWLADRPAARVVAVLAGVCAALVCLALVAVFLHDPDGPGGGPRRSSRANQGGPSTSGVTTAVDGASAAGVDIFTLATAACYNEIDSELGTVTVELCSQAHDGEIYHRFTVGGAADRAARFPGDAKIEAAADAACATQFAAFVGVTEEASSLAFLYWFPDETDWASGLRDVMCVVVAGTEGEKQLSSAQGVRR